MRVHSRILLATATAFFSLTAGIGVAADPNLGPAASVSQDELAIYSAVLMSWLGPKHGRQLVNERLGPAPRPSAAANADCVKGLRFAQPLAEPPKEKMLSSAAFQAEGVELIDGEAWTPIDPAKSIAQGHSVASSVDEGISRSLITFSQVIFSADHRDALVRFSMLCGALCGTGSTLRMHKSNGEWTIATRCAGYIS